MKEPKEDSPKEDPVNDHAHVAAVVSDQVVYIDSLIHPMMLEAVIDVVTVDDQTHIEVTKDLVVILKQSTIIVIDEDPEEDGDPILDLIMQNSLINEPMLPLAFEGKIVFQFDVTFDLDAWMKPKIQVPLQNIFNTSIDVTTPSKYDEPIAR